MYSFFESLSPTPKVSLSSAFQVRGRLTLTGVTVALLLTWTTSVPAQSPSMQGNWLEPSGGVIQVAPCGPNLCAKLIAFTRNGPTTDVNNKDTSLRNRPICNLQLGSGFKVVDAQHAEGGQIYDPKTGKTYSAAITGEGDTLRLRGYVGVKLFGKTEVWQRFTQTPVSCSK